MGKYRKAIAAALGITALVAMRYYDVSLYGVDAVVLDLIVGALVSFGVYAAPNEH